MQKGDMKEMAVKYRCHRRGSCIVTAEVPFFPNMAPYRPLRWSWTKLCGGSAVGIDVTGVPLKEGGGSDEELGRKQLARDGASDPKDVATPWVVSSKVDEHQVQLLNDEKRSLETEVKVTSLQVRCLDSIRCRARLEDPVPRVLAAGAPSDLRLQYDCLSSGNSLVQLILTTEGHDPIVATWAKDCRDSWTLPCSIAVCVGWVFCCLGCCAFASKFADEDKLEEAGGPKENERRIDEEQISTEEVVRVPDE